MDSSSVYKLLSVKTTEFKKNLFYNLQKTEVIIILPR